MNPKYKFGLTLVEYGVPKSEVPVYPNYKDDLSIDYELETNQHFYRAKLSGKLTFLRGDYDLIKNAGFETEFLIKIYISETPGIWSELFNGSFMKTDCTINEDDRIIVVQPEVRDEYNDVLAGMEKEFDLAKLLPETQHLTLRKRPLIQLYTPGESVVSCFLGGTHWEQDVNVTTNTEDLINKYHFALNASLREIIVTGAGTTGANGVYAGKLNGSFYNGESFYIKAEETLPHLRYVLSIYKDNVLYYQSDELKTADPVGKIRFNPKAGAGTPESDGIAIDVYARYICDVDSIYGKNTYAIPADDIVENNRNYRRAIGYAVDDIVTISARYSDEPTEWGLADNGKYFVAPYLIWNPKFYPIARSEWRNTSVWFIFSLMDWALEENARKKYVLRDTYTLSSCIDVLLNKIAPGIRHRATAEYSEFLYGAGRYDNAGGFRGRLLISPKSNIINGEYQTPAQKSPITLRAILNMLRDVYKCYWYIEDGKFKIEQIEFFRNGGTYNYIPNVAYDLTKLQNVRNGKKWAFATSEYTFDKVDLAERYQFEWMDDVTEAFRGEAIEVNSKFVSAGKIEEINVSNFTTDIDLMLLNPGAFSADGYALFCATGAPGSYELPFYKQTVGNAEYILQNGFLANIYLQPTYWVYDMPAENLEINGAIVYAKSIERKKKQTLRFPAAIKINPLQLVATYLGNGQIDKINVNLCSSTAKATLKYDTTE